MGGRGLQKNPECVRMTELKHKTLYCPNEFVHDCRYHIKLNALLSVIVTQSKLSLRLRLVLRMWSAPKRFVDDFYEIGLAKVGKVEKRPNIDKNLYEAEIVEVNKERKQMKIHFVGFSEEFDEWRDYDCERDYFPFVGLEKMFLPNGESV